MDKMRAERAEKAGGHLKTIMAHDMHLFPRRSILKRLLTLLIGVALLIFVVTFYHTLIPSYMDLMDDIMESGGGVLDSDMSTFPTAEPALPCLDGSGWVEEWIASGVMPKCSLARQSTIDVLYTYTTPHLQIGEIFAYQ